MLERINALEKQAKQILDEIKEIKEKANVVALGSLNPGDTFRLCDREFIVLAHEGEVSKVISKDFWGENKVFGNDKNYAKSKIREFIEKEILPKIEAVVGKENVVEHEIHLEALDGGNDFGKLKCKVHPIDFMEARKYFPLLFNEKLNDWWWTCTPWNSGEHGYQNALTVVSPSGRIDCDGYYDVFGVRPFCILKSNIFVSR